MKKILSIAVLSALALGSCTKMPVYSESDSNYVSQEEIEQNVNEIFGTTFSPDQDWSSISTKSVSIKADANLKDIVKVQILTESPFLNEDATVLNEIKTQKGEIVTLVYDAPTDVETLIAACFDSDGKCYVQAFSVGQESVSFASTAAAKTRAAASELPDASAIILKSKTKSINTKRAEDKWNVWKEASGQQWLNDYLWEPKDGSLTNSWKIELGSIYRDISPLTSSEENNIKAILGQYLAKVENDGKTKKNNLKSIRNSQFFSMEDNYLTTNGIDPVTLIPIQAFTTEFKMNEVYYYYYDPQKIAGKSESEVLAFLKALPKYKAIRIEKVETSNEMNVGALLHKREYLLPYYGDEEPSENTAAISTIFPKGYKIGFFNRKRENDNTSGSRNGCTYGDGRLNYETNHVPGHYLSAVDKSLGGNTNNGMQWTDPRIAIFCVNDKTYMCFEDGADCNYCDMVIEVSGGTELIDETVEVPYTTYTFCFEDRLKGDYDMNDVIIKARRISETQIEYSLVACGAYDELYLRNINGGVLNENTEIHHLFGANTTEIFINTENGITVDPVVDVINVDKSFSFSDLDKQIYIYNKTFGYEIKLAKKGQDPHGIIIPSDYAYPKEKIRISDAYLNFTDWGTTPGPSYRSWYRDPVTGMVIEN